MFIALDNKESYEEIQRDIRSTSRENPNLDNMVLRLQIEVRTTDSQDPIPITEKESSERSVF